jgi:hypothetical protein
MDASLRTSDALLGMRGISMVLAAPADPIL